MLRHTGLIVKRHFGAPGPFLISLRADLAGQGTSSPLSPLVIWPLLADLQLALSIPENGFQSSAAFSVDAGTGTGYKPIRSINQQGRRILA